MKIKLCRNTYEVGQTVTLGLMKPGEADTPPSAERHVSLVEASQRGSETSHGARESHEAVLLPGPATPSSPRPNGATAKAQVPCQQVITADNLCCADGGGKHTSVHQQRTDGRLSLSAQRRRRRSGPPSSPTQSDIQGPRGWGWGVRSMIHAWGHGVLVQCFSKAGSRAASNGNMVSRHIFCFMDILGLIKKS